MIPSLDLLVKPTAILFCAAVLTTLLRRASASMRHGVWILALIGAVALPIASTVTPRIELPLPSRVQTSVSVLPVEQPQENVASEERGLKGVLPNSPPKLGGVAAPSRKCREATLHRSGRGGRSEENCADSVASHLFLDGAASPPHEERS